TDSLRAVACIRFVRPWLVGWWWSWLKVLDDGKNRLLTSGISSLRSLNASCISDPTAFRIAALPEMIKCLFQCSNIVVRNLIGHLSALNV
ncbi:MAG TPA: hypothetical protein P5016_11995, partial [Verrucomicrobiales bacterium]|nr:hypothetical protein [Verrucomicrobiales bacterium]